MTSEPRKSTRRRRSTARRRARPARGVSAPPESPAPEPVAAVPETPPAASEEALPPDIPAAQPEADFAARAAARGPEPERPFPSARRAIFFDVENTSRVQHIARVIDYLAVDRLGRRTDFVAVGNWRVIGHDTARLLARHGAQLLHSAPSVGVKDWSDLRIAVAAGVWLGTARPGDILEIISDDRAFDAVGDVATGLGIAFRRLSYRGLTGQPRSLEAPPEPEPEAEAKPSGTSRRRGRRGGRGRREAVAHHVAPAPAVRHVAAEAGHTAPHDELLGVARDLIGASPSRSVTLDALANALKARGFSRPPGSPRLITRLRRLRDLEVSRAGQITLVDQPEEPSRAEAPPPEPSRPEPQPVEPPSGPPAETATRSFEERRAEVEAALRGLSPASSRPGEAGPPAEAEAGAGPDAAPRRRRSRRGGRRRRRHGAPAVG